MKDMEKMFLLLLYMEIYFECTFEPVAAVTLEVSSMSCCCVTYNSLLHLSLDVIATVSVSLYWSALYGVRHRFVRFIAVVNICMWILLHMHDYRVLFHEHDVTLGAVMWAFL
jgi:hypothetical protein